MQGGTYVKNAGSRRVLVELDDTHEEICERRAFYVPQNALHDIRLRLDESQHLSTKLRIYFRQTDEAIWMDSTQQASCSGM